MIDPVALDRLMHAVATDQRAKFDAPLPDGTQDRYFQELVWQGYTVRQIERATGWNGSRIQRRLRETVRRPRPDNGPELAYAHTSDVQVDCSPGAIVLTIAGRTSLIEGSDYDLMCLGRIIYSAATNHLEQTA